MDGIKQKYFTTDKLGFDNLKDAQKHQIRIDIAEVIKQLYVDKVVSSSFADTTIAYLEAVAKTPSLQNQLDNFLFTEDCDYCLKPRERKDPVLLPTKINPDLQQGKDLFSFGHVVILQGAIFISNIYYTSYEEFIKFWPRHSNKSTYYSTRLQSTLTYEQLKLILGPVETIIPEETKAGEE